MKNTINKDRVFWFHYNKPASVKAGKPKVTVHYKGICHIVDNISCNVPTFGYLRNEQPKFVIKGKCQSFEVIDGIAIIK